MPSSGAIVPTEKYACFDFMSFWIPKYYYQHAWRCIITKLCVGEQIRFTTPGTGLDTPPYDGCGCIYMVRRKPAMRMVENSGRDPVDCERTRLSEFSSVRRACPIDGSS